MKHIYPLFLFVMFSIGSKAQFSLAWAKATTGTNTDYSQNRTVATDASGNAYTAGWFTGTIDFDPGTAVYNLTSASTVQGTSDIFVNKLDALGNFVWAKQIGGPANDIATSVIADAAGDIYVSGTFSGTVDFDPGPGIYTLTATSSPLGTFLLKLNASGSFLWAGQIGGASGYAGIAYNSLACDGSGNLYLTCVYTGTVDLIPVQR